MINNLLLKISHKLQILSSHFYEVDEPLNDSDGQW